jgi:N-acyl-D-amino-acid deacylase
LTPVRAADFDLLIRGGQVMDGTGAPAYAADIAVRGDRIAAIGDLSAATAPRVIDAAGLTVVPGFIDLHSHADGGGESGGLRSYDAVRRAAPNLVTQGVTTVVVNQDGRSLANIRRQKDQLEHAGFGPNAILMVGHNTIRRAALTGANKERPATPGEIESMKGMLRAGMEDGAWGMTAGLEYEPGIWSTTEELAALVSELKVYGGLYIVHERSSGIDPMWFVPSRDAGRSPGTMLDSVLETIAIAEQTGVTTVATHIKARGQEYWGKSGEIVEAIASARDRGVPIFADQYPYDTSGSDGTMVLIPRWVLDDSADPARPAAALHAAQSDEATAKKLALDVLHGIAQRGGPRNIVILDHPDRSLVGKSLADVAAARGLTPVEAAYALQFDGYSDRFGGAVLRGFSLDEDDVRRFAVEPWVATASDAGVTLPGEEFMHARYYGTFPRKIRKYALDEKIISVEQAIRSMTGLPAGILRMNDRGRVREGCAADLALLDLANVRDTSTFFEPHRYAEGIPYVIVNGAFVVDGGKPTMALPGRVLSREVVRGVADTDD